LTKTSRKGFPAGPWVLVVGMHRSGTSALTEALGRLGLSLPAKGDMHSAWPDRPTYFESQALVAVDEQLLNSFGGTWSAPPGLPRDWEKSRAVTDLASTAELAAWRAFPGDGPLAWKDPRLCLLLPWWRSILPRPLATLFVWRSPMAVAQSLRSRNHFVLSHGHALWELYNRHALAALGGHRVLVMNYEEMVQDPVATMNDVADWLYDQGCLLSRKDRAEIESASASVSESLVRHGGEGDIPEILLQEVEILRSLVGAHERLPDVEFPPPPAWMGDAILQRQMYETVYAQYLRYAKWRRKIPILRGASVRSSRKPQQGDAVGGGGETRVGSGRDGKLIAGPNA